MVMNTKEATLELTQIRDEVEQKERAKEQLLKEVCTLKLTLFYKLF